MKIHHLLVLPAVAAMLLATAPRCLAQDAGSAGSGLQPGRAQASANALAHAPARSHLSAPPLPAGSQSLQPGVGEAPDVAKRGRHAHRDPSYDKKDLTRDDTVTTPAIVPPAGKN